MEEKIIAFDEKINLNEKDDNLEEVEPAFYILEKGKVYKEYKENENALKMFREVLEKTKSFNLKMDAVFEIMHLSVINKDMDTFKLYLDMCKKFLNEGGDWEKRNRMKVYEGIYCIFQRELKEAGKLFLEALMTFTTYELFDYKTFVFYTSVCNIISVDRNTLKNRIIDNSDVVACIKDIPDLEDFLTFYYSGQYAKFFETFIKIIDRLKTDFYMSKHLEYFVKEMRIKAYSQYLRKLFILYFMFYYRIYFYYTYKKYRII
jgi:26S proteasome regulatory subunit N7